ncbi:hypothetical protein GBAR_LOCUS28684 [Geodia barretti]|uniref:Uncharacterized protein n=1 Tax=Geodia barretti TaxID=519541 RepID=A0AA35TSU0_GEOBA|nr:hypothetical protein GBAR_LOCUS28684 [Geodia barretti]
MYLPRKTVADEAHHSYLAARVASPTHLDSFFKSVMVVEEGPRTYPPSLGKSPLTTGAPSNQTSLPTSR